MDEEDVLFEADRRGRGERAMKDEKRGEGGEILHFLLRRFALFAAFFSLGLCHNLPGSTFLDIASQTGSYISSLSSLFILRGSTYLAMVGVLTYFCPSLSKFVMIACSILLAALGNLVAGFMSKGSLFFLFIGFQGALMAALDRGGLQLHNGLSEHQGQSHSPILNMAFGLGGIAAPIVSASFLSINSSSGILNNVNYTIPEPERTYNLTQAMDEEKNLTNSDKNETEHERRRRDAQASSTPHHLLPSSPANSSLSPPLPKSLSPSPTSPATLSPSPPTPATSSPTPPIQKTQSLSPSPPTTLSPSQPTPATSFPTPPLPTSLSPSPSSPATLSPSPPSPATPSTTPPIPKTQSPSPSPPATMSPSQLPSTTLLPSPPNSTTSFKPPPNTPSSPKSPPPTPTVGLNESTQEKNAISDQGITHVQSAYAITAVLMIIVSLLFFYLQYSSSGSLFVNPVQKIPTAVITSSGTLFNVMALVCFLTTGLQTTYSSLLMVYAVEFLHFSKIQGIYLLCTFWTFHFLRNTLSVCFNPFTSASKILMGEQLLSLAAILALLLGLNKFDFLIWVCTTVLGFSLSQVVPCGSLWAVYRSPLIHKGGLLFELGASFGEIALPTLTISLMVKYPDNGFYTIAVFSLIALILSVLVYYLAPESKEEIAYSKLSTSEPREDRKETVQQWKDRKVTFNTNTVSTNLKHLIKTSKKD